jgi:beta-N-acetylhexosaminidase
VLVRRLTSVLILLSCSGSISAKALSEKPKASSDPQHCIENLPLSVRIGQLLLPLTSNGSGTTALLGKGLISGFAITGTLNQKNAAEIRKISELKFRYGALIASDEEGGTVQRYRKIISPLPSAKVMADSYTPEEAYNLYFAYGQKLKEWGVSVVFGPVVDVGFGPGIGKRSYSNVPKVVIDYAKVAIQAYTDAGLMPVLKHFPGHGDTTNDSHNDVAISKNLEQLKSKDLLPYELLNQYSNVGVMVGHLIVPGTTNDLPSTMSQPIIKGLLRTELGFRGTVFSDALGMGAVANYYSEEETARAFLSAGGTILIVPSIQSALNIRKAVEKQIEDKKLGASVINKAALQVFRTKGINPCKFISSGRKTQPR